MIKLNFVWRFGLVLFNIFLLGLSQDVFNLDVNKPVLLTMPVPNGRTDSKSTYFGASLALGKNAAYVGAPQYQNGGAVFRCPITANQRDGVTCRNLEDMQWLNNHGM